MHLPIFINYWQLDVPVALYRELGAQFGASSGLDLTRVSILWLADRLRAVADLIPTEAGRASVSGLLIHHVPNLAVTNQVTTTAGNGRHSATYPDTAILPTCCNLT